MKDFDYVKSDGYTRWGMQGIYYLFHVSPKAKEIIEKKLCCHREIGRFQYTLSDGQFDYLQTLLN